MEIPEEKHGPAGVPCELHVLALFPNDVRKDEERLYDKSPRTFKIVASLAKVPVTNEAINGKVTPEDGASYIMAPSDVDKIQLIGSGGNFHVTKNRAGELSTVECECIADSVFVARCMFQRAVLPALDHLSYLYNCPILIDKISFTDEKNGCQAVDFVGPYRKVPISKALMVLHEQLRPVYSLYREAKNSASNFYRFLCYYKILEGLLGKLRADCFRTAKAAGMDLKIPRQVVPDHPDLQEPLRVHVGEPIKAFFDNVLTPEFRNAVAHFATVDRGILDVSDPIHLATYAGMVHITELCVRLAIADHETLLSKFQ